MNSPLKKSVSGSFVSAFSNKLSAIIEASGESQDSWAEKFGLQRANFRKLIHGTRPAGPKLTGKILSIVPADIRTQLVVAYLFDALVEIAMNMGTTRKASTLIRSSALPAMVKVAMENNDEIDLSEALGPLEPKVRKLMAMNDPVATKALSAVMEALISKSR
jgi:hypothetical protein